MTTAQIENGIVVQAISGGSAEWCAATFGGTWISTDLPIGVGCTYTVTDGFRRPYPHAGFTWDGQRWQPSNGQMPDGHPLSWDAERFMWS